jgi:hypothetical protein
MLAYTVYGMVHATLVQADLLYSRQFKTGCKPPRDAEKYLKTLATQCAHNCENPTTMTDQFKSNQYHKDGQSYIYHVTVLLPSSTN